jgi:alanine racemase
MEMVRLGIGIYGIDSSHQVQNQLQTVFAMKATISQLKSLKPGETVGYNRQGRILQPTKIATVGIGYADGLLRLAGNGRHQVLVRGQLAPTVGNICMDMCMVDVSKISDVQEGDEVIIFGKQPTVQDLADVYQTIPYEVFTNISSRVKRVYVQT